MLKLWGAAVSLEVISLPVTDIQTLLSVEVSFKSFSLLADVTTQTPRPRVQHLLENTSSPWSSQASFTWLLRLGTCVRADVINILATIASTSNSNQRYSCDEQLWPIEIPADW